jgi:hypothetical protein
MRCLIIVCALTVIALDSLAQPEPYPILLEKRVAQATLIVVGKLRLPQLLSKHTDCRIEVEEVLFGAIPTNGTLVVSYTESGRFSPSLIRNREKESYICFVTTEGVEQKSSLTYATRGVGQSAFAHDAFELATDKTLRDVKDLIKERKRRK